MATNAYQDPIYNLKAVVERTGVTADALRAWERRYGLPKPARTEAGHRIYSQRDIDVVRWLVARQEEGLRIGRAVKLWQSLEGEGRDPLRTMPLPAETPAAKRPMGETVAELRRDWLAACLAYEEQAAEQALTRALAMYPPQLVYSQIIGLAIAEIGHGWYRGDVTPQQEHFASQLAMRRLQTLMEAAPPPTRRGRILAACPPGEEHTLGLLTFSLLLRRNGWDVVYLGAKVPLKKMEDTIAAAEPDLIVLAAQQLHSAASLLKMARLEWHTTVPLAFGGRIFNEVPDLQSRIPGHFLGPTIDRGVTEAERLLTTARPVPEVELPGESARAALLHYRERRPTLEAHVEQALTAAGLDIDSLRELNESFARAIEAALTFDDTDLLGHYVDWLTGLGERQRPSLDHLRVYLQAYLDASQSHLDARAARLVNWLSRRTDQPGVPVGEAP